MPRRISNRYFDSSEVPLRALVIDADEFTRTLLQQGLKNESCVLDAIVAQDILEANGRVTGLEPNVIFVDPLSLGLEEASRFVFAVREGYPEITFVLYVDVQLV
jgi:hypothetical protein